MPLPLLIHLSDLLTPELLITLFGTLLTAMGGLVVWIFAKLERKVDRIEAKIDANEDRNQHDHARVDACLSRVEESLRSVGRDLARHERELGELRAREE